MFTHAPIIPPKLAKYPLSAPGVVDSLNLAIDAQVTVSGSNTVNNIHMVVLAVEGVVLTIIVVWYVWTMAQKASPGHMISNRNESKT